jgi:hypothetical protein
MTHLTEERAAQWVAGVLDDAEADAVAEHARVCVECEQRLVAQAQLEVKLVEALSAGHFTSADAGRWAAGLLEAERAAQLERHAIGCADCERRLQAQARTEVALQAAVLSARPPRAAKWWVVPLVAPLAAAAAVALLLWHGTPAASDARALDAGSVEFADATHFDGEEAPPEAFAATSPFAL